LYNTFGFTLQIFGLVLLFLKKIYVDRAGVANLHPERGMKTF